MKGLEDQLALGFGDAGAIIAHAQHELLLAGHELYVKLWMAFAMKRALRETC